MRVIALSDQLDLAAAPERLHTGTSTIEAGGGVYGPDC
jgi:hypothetical protein